MTAPGVTEREFQGQVFELARVLGWEHVAHFRAGKSKGGRWSTPMSGDVGFPDMVLVRERVVFAELKVDAATPRARETQMRSGQLEWLNAIRAAGGEAYLWRPSDWDRLQGILGHRHVPARLGVLTAEG